MSQSQSSGPAVVLLSGGLDSMVTAAIARDTMLGVQFHPELKSKPFEPHPLFTSFIEAAVKQARLV